MNVCCSVCWATWEVARIQQSGFVSSRLLEIFHMASDISKWWLWSNTVHAKRQKCGHRPFYWLHKLNLAEKRFQGVLGVGFQAFWALFFCLVSFKKSLRQLYCFSWALDWPESDVNWVPYVMAMGLYFVDFTGESSFLEISHNLNAIIWLISPKALKTSPK
jgi:hypothetical protein